MGDYATGCINDGNSTEMAAFKDVATHQIYEGDERSHFINAKDRG